MRTINIKDLMTIERILLEIETRFKFSIMFGDAYNLHRYLIEVGKVTSYAFLIQDEFNEKYHDTEKLKEYHKMVMESYVDFDFEEIVKFINKIQEQIKDEKLNTLIGNLKFW